MTIPAAAATEKVPLLILVHGSGPHDRDETLGPNKIFKELAWGLAAQNIAVLRYDKRTLVYPEACAALPSLTVYDETIDDVTAAVADGRALGYDRIYIAGHSLGGMLIPRIAAETPEVAGYIMLAAPARSLLDLMEEQYRYIYSLREPLSETDQAALEQALQKIEAMRNVTADSDLAAADLMGLPVSYLVDLQGYAPAVAAKSMQQPLLILQGEADYQVTMEDYALFADAVGGQDNVTMISYPRLNHIFMTSPYERSRPDEYQEQGCVEQQVIDDIAGFLKGTAADS